MLCPMSVLRKTLIAILLAYLGSAPVFAQDITTQGKEFWLSYMHNGFKDHDQGGWVTLQVLVSAKRDCSGTISNPNTSWQQDFTVRANTVTAIDIPQNHCYHDDDDFEEISNRGIKVVATDTISVYSTNIAHVSFDASYVLPTESLGDDYIIQTYDQSHGTSLNNYVNKNLTSAFLIVATEDDTEIDITPTTETFGHRPAGETFSITLNAGQTYHVRSNRTSNNRDLSGTRITAHDCKKIAVFNGNTLTCIPTSMSNGFDHVYEQAMPLRSWGKNFVVTSSADRDNDYVKITSAYDNNVITKNGVILTTLQGGQSYTFKMPSSDYSCFISATQTSAVYLYHESFNEHYGSRFGDPSMVWIAPVEQRIDEVTFSTFDHHLIDITSHYVNIIVKTEDIGSVYLDGRRLPASSFLRVNGNEEYSFTREEINHAVHQLRCDNGFNAHVYGFGDAKGYAYMVGSKALDLNTEILVNDEEVKPNETYQACSTSSIEFFAKVNFQDYDLHWDFGDGTTSTDNPVSHNYSVGQIYTANLVITTDEVGCTAAESDTTFFYVSVGQGYNTVIDTLACSPFYFGGELYNDPGYFEHVSTTALGCDSIFKLTLDLQYTPDPTDILPRDTVASHWVVPATEFQVNSYEFSIYDHEPRCVWDSVKWTITGNCDWALDTSGDPNHCELYVVEYTPDTVWLSANVYNACSDSLGITRKHWLVCSFYGAEEHKVATADFSVVPNPNNGQMTISFDNLFENTSIKIYDMSGTLIDTFTVQCRMAYTMKRSAPGIYYFVANSKEGTLAKKVVITQ